MIRDTGLLLWATLYTCRWKVHSCSGCKEQTQKRLCDIASRVRDHESSTCKQTVSAETSCEFAAVSARSLRVL